MPLPEQPEIVNVFPTRVYLTGFMGSGKTTVGKAVSRLIGYNFYDLDDLIASKAGITVQEIFSTLGEGAFRVKETECLRATSHLERAIVALGGGALTNESNLQFVRDHGIVVYLRVPVSEIVRRLRRSRTVRPLLLGPDGIVLNETDLVAKIEAFLSYRRKYYEQAHLIVETAGLEVEEAAARVVDALQNYFSPHVGR